MMAAASIIRSIKNDIPLLDIREAIGEYFAHKNVIFYKNSAIFYNFQKTAKFSVII